MAVYVDEISALFAPKPGSEAARYGSRWCHLIADSEPELRAFADRLGLNAGWIQRPGTRWVHFDLTPRLRAHAIKCGARALTRAELAERLATREGATAWTA